jgi:hypothetical protein
MSLPQAIQHGVIINPSLIRGLSPPLEKVFVVFLSQLRLQGIGRFLKTLVITGLSRILSFLDPCLGLINLGLEIVDFPPKFTGTVDLSIKLGHKLLNLAFGGH